MLLRRNGKPVTLMKRAGPTAWLCGRNGRRQVYEQALLPSETALGSSQDVANYPEVFLIRQALLDWRFYHDFRTDRDSPIRQPALTITTPTLSSDGHDLGAVLNTVMMIREEAPDIEAAIEEAFPGARLDNWIKGNKCGFSLAFPDAPRAFDPHELSDGTLKYLCLLGALLGYRLPSFVALNEPETSLHPDLMPALAKLIARAAMRTQIWVVTHSQALAEALTEETGVIPITVEKIDGATGIDSLTAAGEFREDTD